MHLRYLPLLTAVIAVSASAQTLAAADRPDVRPGDSWTYEHTTFPSEAKRQFTVRVREVTDNGIVTGGPASGSVFSRHWALEESKNAQGITYRAEPGRPLVQFPLDVGKRWNGNLTATLADGWVQRWQGQAVVEKTESITVPAGTFDSYLIRYEGYYNTRNGASNVRWVESIWYAPEARRWVKRDWTWSTSSPHGGTYSERQREELLSFSRAKAKPSANAEPAPEK